MTKDDEMQRSGQWTPLATSWPDRSVNWRAFLHHCLAVLECADGIAMLGATSEANSLTETFVGLKDSSGDWANARAICKRFPGFQQSASKARAFVGSIPLVPAVKAILAQHYGDPGRTRVRPPLHRRERRRGTDGRARKRSDRTVTSKSIRGFAHRLTQYGDDGFARFLRESFLMSSGFGVEALDRPVVAICDTGSDYNPCHATAPQLVEAITRGVTMAGGLPMVFPTISLHESFAHRPR
jgi:hypothetical protein